MFTHDSFLSYNKMVWLQKPKSSLEVTEEQHPEETENPAPTERESSVIGPPSYDGNTRKRRKDELQSTLIKFMKTPIPTPPAPTIPETNPDRSFFESLLPSICEFTEDQKIDFRSEVLNLVKRMR